MRQPSLSHLYFESVRLYRVPVVWFACAVLFHIGLFCIPMRNYAPSRQGIVFYHGNGGVEVELIEESARAAIEQPAADDAEVSPVTDIAFAEPDSIPDQDSTARKAKASVLASAPHHTEAKRETEGTLRESRRAGTKAAQPASQVFTTQPPYPPEARELGLEGAVRLQVRIGVDGCPRNVKIVRSSGRSDFDLSSLRTIQREWRFRPARSEDGVAVESTIVVRIAFNLDNLKS
jgi:TonB family protein